MSNCHNPPTRKQWFRIFKALVFDPDWEWEFIDGSYVKAHQHSAGATGQETQAMGKGRAGNTTKIHLAVDGYGLPVEFEITGGEVNDCSVPPDLITRTTWRENVCWGQRP